MKCAECGKKIGFFEKKKEIAIGTESWDVFHEKEKRVFCLPCYEQFIKELKSRRDCGTCAYFDIVDKYHKDIDYGYTMPYCKKLDLELKSFSIKASEELVPSNFYFEAEKCVHFITEEEYREKALKGEIEKGKVSRLLDCEYCDTQYDAGKYPRCPNCGATPKRR